MSKLIGCIGIFAIVILVFMFLAYNSVYSEYGGIDDRNGINWTKADNLCYPNKIIDKLSSCNHISIYCKSYWFPLHSYTHAGAIRNYNYNIWWFEDE